MSSFVFKFLLFPSISFAELWVVRLYCVILITSNFQVYIVLLYISFLAVSTIYHIMTPPFISRWCWYRNNYQKIGLLLILIRRGSKYLFCFLWLSLFHLFVFLFLSMVLILFMWFLVQFPLLGLSINASVTSSTEERKSKTVILMEKGQMYLHLNQFVNKVFMSLPVSIHLIPILSKLVSASLFSIIVRIGFGNVTLLKIFCRFLLWLSWRLWEWKVIKKLCRWLEEILDIVTCFCPLFG